MMLSETVRESSLTNRHTHPQTDTTENNPPQSYIARLVGRLGSGVRWFRFSLSI